MKNTQREYINVLQPVFKTATIKMAPPRIELGHGPRQRPGLPLAYEATQKQTENIIFKAFPYKERA
jgi:hypothetical protein